MSDNDILQIRVSRKDLDGLQALLNRYCSAICNGEVKNFAPNWSWDKELDEVDGYMTQIYQIMIDDK